MSIKLITFTGEHAAGGVPRWVRDFKAGIEAESFCWADICSFYKTDAMVPEWEKARILNQWLKTTRRIDRDDVIICDGYWGLGLEEFPHVVSVCHGIWSHLIKEEADAGKRPDFPLQHAQQVEYRRKHLERGGRLVAVSQFIQHQMEIQWGFKSEVINNAIDLERFKPVDVPKWDANHVLVIHGVNDRGNENKGWSHIQHLKNNTPNIVDILSLDEAAEEYRDFGYESGLTKYEVLAMADLVVIPSAFEGNSYFLLECLACDVPVVAYDVGLMHEIHAGYKTVNRINDAGIAMDRTKRSKEETFRNIKRFFERIPESEYTFHPREVAKLYSIQNFHSQWRDYLKREFGYED